MKKKGSVLDLFSIMFWVFVIAIALLIAVYLSDQINPFLKNMFGAGQASTALDMSARVFQATDYIILFIIMVTGAITILVATQVPTHPAWFFLNLIMIAVLLVVAPMFSNAMRSFWIQPQFAIYAEGGGAEITYPIMTRLFQNLPYVMAGFALILSIAQFAKSRSDVI